MHTDKKQIRNGLIILLTAYVWLQFNPKTIKDNTLMDIGSILSSIFGGGMGMLGQKWSQEQDYQNQMRLMQEQQRMGQQNALYNQGLALDTWEKTNYPAQVEQMRKAGLNVGLMYKGAGPGGTTGNQGMVQPSISAPPKFDPGMAIQTALNTARARAEIKNIEADTKVKEATAPKTEAETGRILADTQNIHVDTELKNLDVYLKRITTDIQEATKPDIITEIKSNAQKAVVTLNTAGIENQIAKETAQQKIQQVILATTNATLQIELQKGGLWKIGSEIKNIDASTNEIAQRITNMVTQRQQEWAQLNIQAQELAVKQLLASIQAEQIAFNTSTPEQIKQWLSALTGAANVAGGLKGGQRPMR